LRIRIRNIMGSWILRNRICVRMKSWIGIRIYVAIQELMLKTELWTLTMEAWRLKRDLGGLQSADQWLQIRIS
jgi:hypothetical protein